MEPSDSESGPTADGLSSHEADSVETVVALHRDHHDQATAAQRAIDGLTDRLGRPVVAVALVAVFALWTILAARSTDGRADGPVFAWLEFGATIGALLIALLILVTQRRADQLAERRSRLNLDLTLLSDRRSAKIIALLEEFRRDQPNMRDREDAESTAMATPTDASAVSAALEAET